MFILICCEAAGLSDLSLGLQTHWPCIAVPQGSVYLLGLPAWLSGSTADGSPPDSAASHGFDSRGPPRVFQAVRLLPALPAPSSSPVGMSAPAPTPAHRAAPGSDGGGGLAPPLPATPAAAKSPPGVFFSPGTTKGARQKGAGSILDAAAQGRAAKAQNVKNSAAATAAAASAGAGAAATGAAADAAAAAAGAGLSLIHI